MKACVESIFFGICAKLLLIKETFQTMPQQLHTGTFKGDLLDKTATEAEN